MSTFSVSIRLNLRPEAAPEIIDALAPALAEAGLTFLNDAPGLIEGRGVEPATLAVLLDRLASLSSDQEAGTAVLASGAIDDLWIHVRKEPDG